MIFGGFNPCTLIDYPGKTAAMVYTIGCNFRCPYCHNPELVDLTVETTVSDEAVFSFLLTRSGLLDGLVITGGEPTMHGEELLAFMEKVKELGFLIKLDTNGTNPEFLREVTERKLVDYVAMDVKSPLSTYDRTVGRPVNTDAIAESIAFLNTGMVPYEFRTTVVKALLSPDELREIFTLIQGAKRYYIQQFVPTNILNPQLKRKLSYTTEELEAFRSEAEAYVELCGLR